MVLPEMGGCLEAMGSLPTSTMCAGSSRADEETEMNILFDKTDSFDIVLLLKALSFT